MDGDVLKVQDLLQQARQLPADLLGPVEALALHVLPQLVYGLRGQVHAHVREDQRFLQLVKKLVVCPGEAVEHPLQTAGDVLSGLRQALLDLTEKTHA